MWLKKILKLLPLDVRWKTDIDIINLHHGWMTDIDIINLNHGCFASNDWYRVSHKKPANFEEAPFHFQ